MTIQFQNSLIKFSIALILFIFFNTAILAQKMHGLAMHGLPKYNNDFVHLDYVNPNAPKGFFRASSFDFAQKDRRSANSSISEEIPAVSKFALIRPSPPLAVSDTRIEHCVY